MLLKEVGRTLFGGCTLYVIMAACSGSEGSGGSGVASSTSAGGSGGNEGNGGDGGAAQGGRDGGIFDALTDPVREADAEPMSGSRLKGKYLLGSDGSKQYQQTALGSGIGTNQLYVQAVWYDSQRQEDCIFTTASDGQTRCVPVGYEGNVYYSDAQCTQLATHILGIPPQGCTWAKPKIC
jgi:hypothetical protein